jgi:hypothetical protein
VLNENDIFYKIDRILNHFLRKGKSTSYQYFTVLQDSFVEIIQVA